MTSAALDPGRLVVHGRTGKRSRLCESSCSAETGTARRRESKPALD
jgi:hypothetical protein